MDGQRVACVGSGKEGGGMTNMKASPAQKRALRKMLAREAVGVAESFWYIHDLSVSTLRVLRRENWIHINRAGYSRVTPAGRKAAR